MPKQLINGLFISGELKGLIRKSQNIRIKKGREGPTTGQVKEKM